MKLSAAPQPEQSVPEKQRARSAKGVWWRNWEIYAIVLVAAFFRLVFIDKTQFMADHAIFYQMAYDGLKHGLLPISGNRSSTGPLISPLFVYLMMIPAAISPNPVTGAIFIALCNVVGVLLTYLFVNRYYGRLAAALASLFYATSIYIIIFNRDIWQPDLLPPLAVLFIWCLFRGVVEQRRNWFLPAVLLLGVMVQLHTTAIYLVIPLLVAMILAFRTLRLRELGVTVVASLVLFSPYILLERMVHFIDLQQNIQLLRSPTTLNTESLQFYVMFVRPLMHKFLINPVQNVDTHIFDANAQSILLTTPLRYLQPFLRIEGALMPYLLFGAVFVCIAALLWPGKNVHYKDGIVALWKDFQASAERKGLLLLLTWQGLVILLLRHSVALYIHYLLFLAPGMFILLAIALTTLLRLARSCQPSWEKLIRYSLLALSGVVICAQIIGSTSTLVDRAQGNFDSRAVFPEYFDLASLQHILGAADQLAQQRHIKHIYAATEYPTDTSIQYLAQFEKTPIVTFDDYQCIVLPGLETGPVVFIAPPQNPSIETVLGHYADATLAETVPHTGGAPYKLYILAAKSTHADANQARAGWQSLASQAQVLSDHATGDAWLTTRWRIPTAQQPQPRTTYTYHLNSQLNGATAELTCPITATNVGDQMFMLQQVDRHASLPKSVGIQLYSFTVTAQRHIIGSLVFVTFDNMRTPTVWILPADGKQQINMEIAVTE